MTGTNFKGFDLFDDIEDDVLRTRNCAVVLANMAEDHTTNRRINVKGAALVLGYFGALSEKDKPVVMAKFKENMGQRGFALVV